MSDFTGTYYIEYWEEGGGILRYDYRFVKSQTVKNLEVAGVVALSLTAAVVLGPAALGAIPLMLY